jgi:undecaprenyl-diphosphatase
LYAYRYPRCRHGVVFRLTPAAPYPDGVEDILQAIVLGIVQGLTEFLPISSSGHLIIARELFGWDFEDDLTFDVALHTGTLLAVLVYFRQEWRMMLRGAVHLLPWQRRERSVGDVYDSHLFLVLIVGTIPIGVVGVLLDSWAEDELREAAVVGFALIFGGFFLLFAEWFGRRTRSIEDAGLRDSLIVGGAQALSLIPGISRSGATITAGLFDNFDRPDAARFSFLLAAPAIGGAGLFKLGDALTGGLDTADLPAIIAGTISSAVVGWFTIRLLLRYVQTRTYLPFVIYRFAVGIFTLIFLVSW